MFDKEQLYVRANDDISLEIYEGETLGLVGGESGCGKSTLGRTLLQLYDQTDGRTIYYGLNIDDISPRYIRETLENLDRERNKLVELQEEQKAAQEKYDKLPEGEEKLHALEELRVAEREARLLYMDLSQLIGGFMVAENLEHVSEVLLREHKKANEAKIIRDNIFAAEVKVQGIQSRLEEEGKSKADIENAIKKMI